MEWFINGTVTDHTIELISSQLLNNGLENDWIQKFPKEYTANIYYACSTNTEQNSITTCIFSDYVNDIHQQNDNTMDLIEIPKDVVSIELTIIDKNSGYKGSTDKDNKPSIDIISRRSFDYQY